MIVFVSRVIFFISFLAISYAFSFEHKDKIYTIQLFTAVNYKKPKQTLLQKIPLQVRDRIHLHRYRNDVVGCYSQAFSYRDLLKDLQKVKKVGYKDAFIVTTKEWLMPLKKSIKSLRLAKYAVSPSIFQANKANKKINKVKNITLDGKLLPVNIKGIKSIEHKDKIYTIQLFTAVNYKKPKQTLLQKIPLQVRDRIHLHRYRNDVVGCYSQAFSYRDLLKDLQKVKKVGYKDAFIVTTKEWLMPLKKKKIKHILSDKTLHLSKYAIARLIFQANEAYKSANETKAVICYEKLLLAGVKNYKIKNNLCYLYGKSGAWEKAKNIIDRSRYKFELIYAYANGAARTMQKNFYNDLHDDIMLDKSGHLALLAGYYFEKKADIKKAGHFYKMSYQKNRDDIYNIYAYARYLDMTGQQKQAIELYKNIYGKIDKSSKFYKALKYRLYDRGD